MSPLAPVWIVTACLATEVLTPLRTGNLVLRTQRQQARGPHGNIYNFTSGWVDTETRWYQKYGRFEARVSLPPQNATGNWPAFWLMPNPATAVPKDVCWPVGGEIDIYGTYAAGLVPSHVRTPVDARMPACQLQRFVWARTICGVLR